MKDSFITRGASLQDIIKQALDNSLMETYKIGSQYGTEFHTKTYPRARASEEHFPAPGESKSDRDSKLHLPQSK